MYLTAHSCWESVAKMMGNKEEEEKKKPIKEEIELGTLHNP